MLKMLREYFTLGSLATVAAVVGIGSGIYSMTRSGGGGGGGGGGGAGLPGAMTYVPQHQGQADDMWQTLLQQMMGAEGGQADMLMPFLRDAFTNSGYGDLATMMRGWGGDLAGQAGGARGAAGGLRAAGGQMWNTALDPENALHDRTQQRVTDASRAATSARGIGMSPQAGGMETDAVSNFNLDWNDRQLGRQATGMHGLTSAYDSAGRYDQLANADLVGAQSMYQGAGAMPFNLANLFSGAMTNCVYGPASGIMSNLGSYMGLGQAGSAANFNQGQTNLNNLTTGLSQFGQSPGYSWLSNFFTPDSSGSGASGYVDPNGWGGA